VEGKLHEPSMLFMALFMATPPDSMEEDDEVKVGMLLDVESPCMDERRVIISRNVGRTVGSECQQLVMSSSYSGGHMP
jgi:hypothetical protein